MVIITMKMAINAVYNDIIELENNTNSPNETVRNNHYFCRIYRLIRMLADTQAIVSFRFRGVGLMTIATHYNITKNPCSMTALPLVEIELGKPF